MVLAPDEVVDILSENLAYYGNEGLRIDELWQLASKYVLLDDSAKSNVWDWLVHEKSRIIVVGDKRVLDSEDLDYTTLVEKYDAIRVVSTLDNQWITLTGKSYAGNPLGQNPFEILMAVARAGPKGITNIDVSRQTGQDPRSLHGRIAVLTNMGYIRWHNVIYKGANTKLLIYRKFWTDEETAIGAMPDEGRLVVSKFQKAIFEELRKGENGIRYVVDVIRELGLSEGLESRRFREAVKRLEKKGYVKRVILVRDKNSTKRFRCLQLVKDPAEDLDPDDYDSEEDDDFGDFDEFNEYKVDEDDGIAADEETENVQKLVPYYNRFHPLERQLYDFIALGRESGMPSMNLEQGLAGRNYGKNLMRLIAYMIDENPGKGKSKAIQPPHLGHLAIVRGIDFSSRMKFYRYFTQIFYNEFSNKEADKAWGTFPSLTNKNKSSLSLRDLDEKYSSKLPGLLDVVEDPETKQLVPVFHGDKYARNLEPQSDTDSPVPKKRGRPRKRPLSDDEDTVSKKPAKSRGRPRKRPLEGVSEVGDVGRKAVKLEDVEDVSESTVEPAEPEMIEVIATEPTDLRATTEPTDLKATTEPTDLRATTEPTNSRATTEPGNNETDSTVMATDATYASATEIVDNAVSTLAFGVQVKEEEGAGAKPKRKQARYSGVSFANMRREQMLLNFINEKGGAIIGGGELLKDWSTRYSEEEGSTVDRRTLRRLVDKLLGEDKLRSILVSVETAAGTNPKRNILFLPSVDPGSDIVKGLKKKLHDTTKKRYFPPQELSVLEGDVVFINKRYRKLNSQAARQRLQELDRETENNRKRVEPEEQRQDDGSKEKLSAAQRRKALREEQSAKKKNFREEDKERVAEAKRERTVEKKQESTRIDPSTGRAKRKRSVRSYELTDSDLFYRIVIVVRSLLGNTQGGIPWEKVVEFYPLFNASVARGKWARIRKQFGGVLQIQQAMKRFEQIFLEGYEKGDIPYIESSEDYDVLLYVDYWREQERKLNDSSCPLLYEKLDDNYLNYQFSEEKTTDFIEEYNFAPSMVRAGGYLTMVSFSTPKSSSALGVRGDAHNEAKTAIKAIICTEEDKYDANKAVGVLESLGEERCENAIKELENEKAIVYVARDKTKVLPGRNWTFSDSVNTLLQPKLGEDVLVKASDFESKVIESFKSSKPFIMSSFAENHAMISILELFVMEVLDVHQSGVTDGKLVKGYATRAVDKAKLDNDIALKMRPGSDIEHSPAPRKVPPPVSSSTDNIWTSATGELNSGIWRKLVTVALLHIVMRPGTPIDSLERILRPVLSKHEVQTLVKWLCNCGAVVEGHGGYKAEPRWYLDVV